MNLDNNGQPTKTPKAQPTLTGAKLDKFVAETLAYCKERPDFNIALTIDKGVIKDVISLTNPGTVMGAKRAISRFIRGLALPGDVEPTAKASSKRAAAVDAEAKQAAQAIAA